MKKLRTGFTLVELLIAITIILLLSALLFAATISVRDSSRTKVCLSNIRQLSVALAMYASDNDSTYPAAMDATMTQLPDHGEDGRGNSWHSFIAPYIKQGNSGASISCPSTTANSDQSIDAYFHYKTLLSGYAYNENLSQRVYDPHPKAPAKPEYKLYGVGESQLDYSNLIITFADARCGIIAIDHPDIKDKTKIYALFIHELRSYINSQPPGATRHQGGANYSFIDGHVKWFKPEQLNSDEKCDGKTPGFGL